MKALALVRALRPHQWSKNVFVLAALVFAAAEEGAPHPIGRAEVIDTLLAFVAFCLAASAVYLFNDVIDVEADRQHPDKQHRPIPSGEVSLPTAMLTALLLFSGALAIGFVLGDFPENVAMVVALYALINLAYSTYLKKVVLLDAFCISAGFVLRVLAGGFAARAEVSHWLLLCTLFLSLFLALNKRRAELQLLGNDGVKHRAILNDYSAPFLDQMTGVLAACSIICYTMYTVDPATAIKFGEGNRLVWTVPFVAFGVGRYMYLVESRKGGGNPTRIFLGGDPVFLLNTLAWGVTVLAILFAS
ncbi:MAG: decaprenyl-phosphate phosphoribosyltransferase [Planctomycetota bacterium]